MEDGWPSLRLYGQASPSVSSITWDPTQPLHASAVAGAPLFWLFHPLAEGSLVPIETQASLLHIELLLAFTWGTIAMI